MTTINPLVPPPTGAAAPVANAPHVAEKSERETARPVTAAKESDRSDNEEERRSRSAGESERRGSRVDITV